MSPEPDAKVVETSPPPGVAAGIGVVLLALAGVLLFEALKLPPGPAVGVGPAAAMRIVAVLVAILGVAHLFTSWRSRKGDPDAAPPVGAGNRRALAWVLGALAGLMLILQFGGGFIAASAWLFVGTARGFGAPLGAKSVGIGVALSATVYLFFTKALSLGLPAGPLERLFG